MTERISPRSNSQQQRQGQPQAQWQPIEQLTLIAYHIDGMLESAVEQYETLHLARPKPWVLDDYTIGRVIEVFTYVDN